MTTAERCHASDIRQLQTRYGSLDAACLLDVMIRTEFAGRIAAVSAFGVESALLLHLIAEIDRATPIIFLDTGKHFPETLAYRDRLIDYLGLLDVRSVVPDAVSVAATDPLGQLWQIDPDRCCYLRKVQPLYEALHGFDAWITGRKRFQGTTRADLQPLEADGKHIKINPFAEWGSDRIARAFADADLPPHPLAAKDYRSVGCQPCTAGTGSDRDPRSGRWQGLAKSECGIHRAVWARQAAAS